MKIIKAIEIFIGSAFFSSVLLFVSSCSQNKKQPLAIDKTNDKKIAPQITLLTNLTDSSRPIVTFLEKVPKPKTIFISKKPTIHSFVDSITHAPIAPEAQGVGLFTKFSTDQGLAQEAVLYSMIDKKGNFWFGTGGGVSRYDGKSFTNYTTAQGLANNLVNYIAEDKNGDLWFATYGGVSRYDGKGFTNYTSAQGLANNNVYCVMQDKEGIFWFGTLGGGVSSYDGKKFINYTTKQGLVDNSINRIIEDKEGDLWFATRGGVSCYDRKKFTNYLTQHGLANNSVISVAEDRAGNLWFGTNGGGVSRYDGKKFTNFTIRDGLANNTVLCITEDKTGNLWFGTFGGGVSRYDEKTFTNFTTAQGLSNNVYSITEDKTGNLWFGTIGGGVSRYEGKCLSNFTTAQGLASNVVYSITEDKAGNLWFGTGGGGVSRYDRKSFTNYNTTQGLLSNIIWTILKDKAGNLWFSGHGSGVSSYDGKSFTNYTTAQGLVNNSVYCSKEDRAGNLWFGTNGGGISRYDGKSFTNYTTAQGLANNIVNCVAEDKTGNLWLGTSGGGVSRYDNKSFTNYTTAQGLAHNDVVSITEDKEGILWFGTNGGGVSRYDGKSFTNYTTTNGLPDNVINAIIIDSSNIIFGTNMGLGLLTSFEQTSMKENNISAQNRLTNDALKNYIPQFEIYNSSTGYPITDVNASQNAIFKDSKGIIWIGTGADQTALVRFDYSAIHKSTSPPVVILKNIKVNNENICWYDLLPASPRNEAGLDSNTVAPNITDEVTTLGKTLSEADRDSMRSKFADIKFDSITLFYPLPENLVLPYNHNNLTFDFAAVETSRPQLVKYQYILEGYDREWSPFTNETTATYGNIYEGTYTFKIKAKSPFGIWSEPITYTFKVLPPWWRTWWFRTVMGISLLFLLYGIYRWRTAALHKQKRILEQTVKVRTAEVVAEKAVVERQKDVIQKEKEKSDELLLNILPSEVAEELKEKGYTTAKSFDEVTILFSDIKGFTDVAERMTAQELVKEIDTYFSAFDGIIQKYGLEKIKTIGDAYIAAGGLPEKNLATAQNVVEAAVTMQQAVEKLKQERVSINKPYFELRIGIHTGPVVAGVVGKQKFQYDIWGDTVNLAARMEQSGVPGKINISQHTYELIKEQFVCVHRGKIEAKNKGEIDMFFVE